MDFAQYFPMFSVQNHNMVIFKGKIYETSKNKLQNGHFRKINKLNVFNRQDGFDFAALAISNENKNTRKTKIILNLVIFRMFIYL